MWALAKTCDLEINASSVSRIMPGWEKIHSTGGGITFREYVQINLRVCEARLKRYRTQMLRQDRGHNHISQHAEGEYQNLGEMVSFAMLQTMRACIFLT